MSCRTLGRLAPMAALLLASGCADEIAAPKPPLEAASQNVVPAIQQGDVQVLSRAIAEALADPKLRERLLEDLRDSPFPQHKLHLKSYLKGADGAALLDAGADKTKKPKQQLRALLDSLPEMELVVPRSSDRVHWNGSDSLVVFGTARNPVEVLATEGSLRGYTPTGDSVILERGETPAYTIIVLRPRETDFGSNPEARRAATPARSRNTVSSREVEFSLDPAAKDPDCTASACEPPSPAFGPTSYNVGNTTNECPLSVNDETTTSDCDPPPTEDPPPPDDGPYPYAGRNLGVTFAYCTSPAGDDADADGVRDGCEEKLAQSFAPVLKFDQYDRCKEREPYWSVKKWDGRAYSLKVFYLISYYKDCGNYQPHPGDSEFIILTIEASTTYPTWWYTYSVTTSAHRGEIADATKTTSAFDYPAWHQGFFRRKPIVWVSRDKHANYTTASECNGTQSGLIGYGYDHCSSMGGEENVGVPSHAEANIGTSIAFSGGRTLRALRNKVPSRANFLYPYYEVMWGYDVATGSNVEFCGWQGQRSGCSGSYRDALFDYDF